MDLVRERGTGLLLALTPVTIAFEAIEGGPMEGVEAVGNLRAATAVFTYVRGHGNGRQGGVQHVAGAGDRPLRRAVRKSLAA